jgi:hypothetical protein
LLLQTRRDEGEPAGNAMSDDDDTVPATPSEVAAALIGGDVDALVELAKTLQEKTGDHDFVESMVVLIFELLPKDAKDRIVADSAKGPGNIVLFTKPGDE